VTNLKCGTEAFRARQAEVYRSDRTRLMRDSRAARRSIQDHTGRWFFEVMQNCEDARATVVEVRLSDTAVYVADNGPDGFSPQAVKSISGTDYSDKPVGTIGRKGVGFKAVYEITATPQVFTLQDGGLEFDPSKAEDWLGESGLLDDREHVPYEWLPFYTSRSQAEGSDPILRELRDFSTVLRLPLRSKEHLERAARHLSEWPTHALLVFEHIRVLRVRGPAVGYEVCASRSEDAFLLVDSRGPAETRWKVFRHRGSPPTECLASLDADDRERVGEVGFVVAAPVDEAGAVRPADSFLPVHVFYPTEEYAPVRLLLHAEFLVKTDRTAIISIEENRFNSWVADVLADLVISYVNDSYHPESPSAHLRLLGPLPSRDEHPVAGELWRRIAAVAAQRLVLPDSTPQPTLNPREARRLGGSVKPALARRILACTPSAEHLLHESVDRDNEAREALRALGCAAVRDADILDAIEQYAAQNTPDREWIEAAIGWLAHWLGKAGTQSEREQRKKRIQTLPVIPAEGKLVTPESLADKIVTWREAECEQELPEWVPLLFVDDWFRDFIAQAGKDDPTKALVEELGVKQPGENVVLGGVAKAICDYWGKQEGDPDRFLRLLLTREDWREVAQLPSHIRQCPVPARVSGQAGVAWVPAEQAYFGSAWGEHDVARVYEDVDGVAWAEPLSDVEPQRAREVLEALGVVCYPRVLKDLTAEAKRNEDNRIWQAVPGHREHETPDPPLVLDRVDSSDLRPERCTSLIRMLSRHWKQYYEHQSRVTCSVRYRYERSFRPIAVPPYWWDCVLTQLVPPLVGNDALPAPLRECWLPDKSTRTAAGELVPIIDLKAFGDSAQQVQQWLCEVVGVRRTLAQISVDEWRYLLSERVPQIVPAENMAHTQRDKVTRWYGACLRSLDEQDDVAQGALSAVSLLCRRGDQWDYRDRNDIWLADDQEMANAFRDDCWQIELPASLRSHAKAYFALRPLSEHVHVEYGPGRCLDRQTEELRQATDEVLPYIFVSRCSQTTREPEKVREDLASLSVSVVEGLRADLTLDGVANTSMRRNFGHRNKELLISARAWDSRLTSLASALADVLEVKTEADFYENLLRCDSDDARRAKLLAKGATDQEMDRLLRIFRQCPAPEPEFQVVKPPSEEHPARPIISGPVDKPSEATDNCPEQVREPSLKDPETAAVGLSSETRQEAAPPEPREPRATGGQVTSIQQLSEEKKRKIEECGRLAAARKLQEMRYSVKQQPYDHPGYDIVATKGAEELRIEVKAHRYTASVVEITTRELQEYYEHLSNPAIRWELWNVENLAADAAAAITITRYSDIPESALGARQFTVDLRRCRPVPLSDAT